MSAWVCSVCGEVIRQAWDRLERRVEYRRIRDRSSYRIVKTGDICQACADKEVEELRPTSPSPGEQGALL